MEAATYIAYLLSEPDKGSCVKASAVVSFPHLGPFRSRGNYSFLNQDSKLLLSLWVLIVGNSAGVIHC